MSYKVYSLVLWNILFIFLKTSWCLPANYDLAINPYNSQHSSMRHRHQRSFSSYLPETAPPGVQASMGPMNRNMHRRPMYDDNPPVYARKPTYKNEQRPNNERSNLIVLPRGVDEEYAMYPLKTQRKQGFDEEDQDLIHEEEMGDELTFIDKKAPTRYMPDEVSQSHSYRRSIQYVPERTKPLRYDVPSYHMEMAPPTPPMQQQPESQIYNPPTTPYTPRRQPPQMMPYDNYNFVEYGNENMYPSPMMQRPQNNYQPNYQYPPTYGPPQNDYYSPTYESSYVEQPDDMFTAETAAYYPRRQMQPRFANQNNGNYMPPMDINMDIMIDDGNMSEDFIEENLQGMMMPLDSHQKTMESDDDEDDAMLKVPSHKNDEDISDDYLEMENVQQNTTDMNESKHMLREQTTPKTEIKKNDKETPYVEDENNNTGESDESNAENDEYDE